jgi:adenylate kinase
MRSVKILHLFFFGPQGSGKGTQAELLAADLGLVHFSSGDVLRKTAEANTALGRYLRRQLASGALTPIPKLLQVFDYNLKQIPKGKGIIFDGFARQITETRLILNALKQIGRPADLGLLIDISEKETVKRLSKRGVCGKCGKILTLGGKIKAGGLHSCGGIIAVRTDDRPETIRKRLALYRKRTLPVLNHFKRMGLLERIGGERSIAAVHDLIVAVLKKRKLIF